MLSHWNQPPQHRRIHTMHSRCTLLAHQSGASSQPQVHVLSQPHIRPPRTSTNDHLHMTRAQQPVPFHAGAAVQRESDDLHLLLSEERVHLLRHVGGRAVEASVPRAQGRCVWQAARDLRAAHHHRPDHLTDHTILEHGEVAHCAAGALARVRSGPRVPAF